MHLRISCPPHKHPCYFGIDFPKHDELIANKLSEDELKEFLEVDSIGYLSWEGMLGAVSLDKEKYCTGCFSGKYSVGVNEQGFCKFSLER